MTYVPPSKFYDLKSKSPGMGILLPNNLSWKTRNQDHRSYADPLQGLLSQDFQERKTSWETGRKENLQAFLKENTAEPFEFQRTWQQCHNTCHFPIHSLDLSAFNPWADPPAVQWCRTGTIELEPKVRTGCHNRAPSSSGKNWEVHGSCENCRRVDIPEKRVP